MKPRRHYVLLAGVLGLAAAVLPAIASSEPSPSVEAVNVGLYGHAWSPAGVAVGAGGVVAFSNPTAIAHGVEWIGSAKPTCTSGVPVGNTPAAAGGNWSGTCTFAQAGTYTFYCTVHGPEMTGTVVVSADGTTTTTTTTGTGTTGTTPIGAPTPPTSTTPKSEGTPTGPPISGNPTVRAARHGTSVSGSVQVSSAGAGDRLEVDLVVSGAVLGKGKHARHVTVGRYVRSSVKAGKQAFSVALDAKGRQALKRHRRLALTVKVVLTPGYGNPVTRTRSLTVHG